MCEKRAFIAGFFAAIIVVGLCAHSYSRRIKEAALLQQFQYEDWIRAEMVRESIKTAKFLRSGEVTNALEDCESNIDFAVSGLAWFANDIETNAFISREKISPIRNDIITAIGKAKMYRNSFPRQSDAIVSNAFALAHVETNR